MTGVGERIGGERPQRPQCWRIGCKRTTDGRTFVCMHCWRRLPSADRKAIRELAVKGQWDRPELVTDAYRKALFDSLVRLGPITAEEQIAYEEHRERQRLAYLAAKGLSTE